MEFRLLGPLEVVAGTTPVPIAARKQRALLAVLLLNANRTVARERIVDDLWGDAVPASAPKMVQIYVSQLRKALPEPRLHTRGAGYALEVGDDELDLARFERLVTEGRSALGEGHPTEASDLLRRALALWRGPALAEFSEPFAQHESARLDELQLSALEWRLEADLAIGRHGDVVGELDVLTSRQPLRERLRSQQMLALYRAGRHAEALASYQSFRRALGDELGIEPTVALKDLERRMLRQDPELDQSALPAVPAQPLPAHVGVARPAVDGDIGLVLLERDEALARLGEAHDAASRGDGRVVFVSGEPGIGKTSLVTRFLWGLNAGTRVLVGTCDDLSVPRPLGPIRDLAGAVSAPLEEALSAGAAPHDIHALLIAELELPPHPTVLVLEDVHWADEATCDAVTVLGRRIASLPALLVLTFRGGEAQPGHPLYATIGAVRPDASTFVELVPLSETAVASLAGRDAGEVYAATRGNPFYVTELLASRTAADLPPSVANTVVARASRLDDASRRLVELVSVVPTRVATSLLDRVMPDWAEAAEEPERRQLLDVTPRWVRFRHELARNAVGASVPIAARRRLHSEILEALLAAKADPADIVHHAEAAGADDVVAEYAVVAARRAAALESNREAYSHYRRASRFVDRLALHEQATVLEELAAAAYAVSRLDDAFLAIERAIAIYGDLGDHAALGRCTKDLSRFHWIAGDGDAARAKALEAIAILEPLGASIELARAYSGVSQLAMLAEDTEQALAWGERALELAIELGDESTRAHALVNLASAKIELDPGETAALLEAHAVADAAGDRHEATRALNNLGYSLMCWVKPEPALRYAQQAVAYGEEHEVLIIASLATSVIAWLRLRSGEWDEAERIARDEIERAIVVERGANVVLAELAVRRGDPDAAGRLIDLAARAERAGEVQRIVPALELRAEWALTSGAPMPTERFEELAAQIRPRGSLAGRFAVRVAGWAAVTGVDIELDQPLSGPYAAMAQHDWCGAADAFGEVGWTYDRALMLSLLDDEESLVEALEIARKLGAGPLTKRVTGRMHELGVRNPDGMLNPRP
jgi:DNA-binding SARP family transcriptional activator